MRMVVKIPKKKEREWGASDEVCVRAGMREEFIAKGRASVAKVGHSVG